MTLLCGVKMAIKLKKRTAYEVVIDEGMRTKTIGFKHRLLGKQRAKRVCKWLCKRGLDARVRCFGQIHMPSNPRNFD
jgi:hypothetical protein